MAFLLVSVTIGVTVALVCGENSTACRLCVTVLASSATRRPPLDRHDVDLVVFGWLLASPGAELHDAISPRLTAPAQILPVTP
jgi:hypothetical protein